MIEADLQCAYNMMRVYYIYSMSYDLSSLTRYIKKAILFIILVQYLNAVLRIEIILITRMNTKFHYILYIILLGQIR